MPHAGGGGGGGGGSGGGASPLAARAAAAEDAAGFECSICLEQVALAEVALLACGHGGCRGCLRAHVAERMAQGDAAVVACPAGASTCSQALAQHELRALLGEAAFAQLDRRALEAAVAVDPSLHACPTPDCRFVVCWSGAEGEGPPAVNCPLCKTQRCLLCAAAPYHTGRRCGEAPPAAAPGEGPEHAAAEAASRAFLTASAGIRRCASCGNGVIKAAGCDKVRCRCGFAFCFVCGTPGATCSCTPAYHGFLSHATILRGNN